MPSPPNNTAAQRKIAIERTLNSAPTAVGRSRLRSMCHVSLPGRASSCTTFSSKPLSPWSSDSSCCWASLSSDCCTSSAPECEKPRSRTEHRLGRCLIDSLVAARDSVHVQPPARTSARLGLTSPEPHAVRNQWRASGRRCRELDVAEPAATRRTVGRFFPLNLGHSAVTLEPMDRTPYLREARGSRLHGTPTTRTGSSRASHVSA